MPRRKRRTPKREKYEDEEKEAKDENNLVVTLNNVNVNDLSPNNLSPNNITTVRPTDPQLSESCKDDSQRSLVPVDSSQQEEKILGEIFSFDIYELLESNQCTKLFQSLIDSGFNVNVKSIINGFTPLMVAVDTRNKDIVEMLLQNGADPSIYDDEGETPLIKAVKVQDIQIFEIIWKFRNNNCFIDHADMKGMTVLHWAAKMQIYTCVQVLLQNEASSNMSDKKGWTPLMFAAAHGNCSIASRLLDAGSNILLEDSNHLTAICIAFNTLMLPLARLLVSKLTVNEATQYIKRLLDKMQGLRELNLNQKSEEESCSEMMTCLIFSISLFSKLLPYKEVFYKQKVVARVLASCQKYLVNCNIVTLVSFLCFICCIDFLDKNCLANKRFVMQFLRAGGPDFILKIASAHHRHQSKMTCAVTYIFPIMVISEVDPGKEWLKHHVKKLLPYTQSLNRSILKDQIAIFDQLLYEFGDLAPLLLIMDRFFNYFDMICRESQEETISELLANEVRLREKREKKRAKRQLQRQQRQMDALSDGLGVLQEGGTISISSEDDMSCDDLDWDQRHFLDGEKNLWAVPFKNNIQLEGSDSSEKKKSWTEYYPVFQIPGNDHQWVKVANKQLKSKVQLQSAANRKSPQIKKKKADDTNQKNKLKNQQSLVTLTEATNFSVLKDNEDLQALLNVESFTSTVGQDQNLSMTTEQSQMTENVGYEEEQTLASLLNSSCQSAPAILKSFQTNRTTYSKQVIKNSCPQEPEDNLQNSVLENEHRIGHKTIDVLDTNYITYSDLKAVPHTTQNPNSSTNRISLNDASKTLLPFSMPSIHFQLDYKPLSNSIKQKSIQVTKDRNENIVIAGHQIDDLSGRISKKSCNGQTNPKVLPFVSGSKRKFHMAKFMKDPEFPSLLKLIDCEFVNFIQLREMRKCFRQISQNSLLCNSVFGHDAFYYASCMSQHTRSILVSEFPIAFNAYLQNNNSCLSTKSPECPQMQKIDKPLLTIGCVKDTYDIVKSQLAGGDTKGIPNRKFFSYRWKYLFDLLPTLPPSKRCIIDGILLPGHLRMYNINPRQGHLIVLGLQADGTELAIKVYKSDECVVKCGILKQLIQPLKLDFNFLIQYRTVSLTKDHTFLSMNVCECNVRQYIEWNTVRSNFDPCIASVLVWHMLKGLKSLHDNGILHGRLKPENLLIDSKGRLLLANYGLYHFCKHHSWSSNNGQTSNQKLECEKCWHPSEILHSEQHKKYMFKTDIQMAGLVAHFIISGGHHPFGKDGEVIMNGWQLHQLSDEASDLVSAMLSEFPTYQPDVQDIMKHPYFWSTGRRFKMLLTVGSHLALLSPSVLELSEDTRKYLFELIKILDSDKKFQEWKSLIDETINGELKKYKNTLTGLVFFIYNTSNRWNQIYKKGNCHLQEPSCYFFQKFPKLFCAVYNRIKISSLRHIIPYRTYY